MEQKPLTLGKDVKIAGICSGFADYFGTDPTLVRLVAIVALLVSGGVAGIAYLVLWAMMPPYEGS